MDIETKECSKCHEEKPLDEFHWKDKAKGKRNSYCNVCTTAYGREHYRKHNDRERPRRIAHEKIRIGNLRIEYLKYLSTHPCVDCGEKDPIVLEFDHVRGVKVRTIADMIGRRSSWASILVEIGKCDVVCANCHRRRTAKVFNWWYDNTA